MSSFEDWPVVPFMAAVVFGAALLSCDLAGSSGTVTSSFFLRSNASWTYRIIVSQSPVGSESTDTLQTFKARMEVVDTGVQIANRSDLFEVKIFPVANPDLAYRVWYDQSPDSLVDVALSPPPLTPVIIQFSRSQTSSRFSQDAPSKRRSVRGLFGIPRPRSSDAPPAEQHNPTEKRINVRQDPRLVLKRPLEIDSTWTARRGLSKRVVLGSASVEVPAGSFDAVRVATVFSPEAGRSLGWSDYYADDPGLARRVLTDTLFPDESASSRIVERRDYKLIDYDR